MGRFMRSKSASYYTLTACVAAAYIFLYMPIIILILFSFNNSLFPYAWKGFTLRWYAALWESTEVWDALRNSVIVAFSAVFLSVTFGVLVVYYSSRSFLARLLIIFYGTLAVPEIVIAAGLLSVFVGMFVPLGLTTLIVAHTLLGIGYVIPLVHTRFAELNYALTEASLDLGATRTQTFFTIILPLLSQVIIAASLLVFVISLDDFLLAFFCAGATTQTLPMYIFSMIRSGATPLVNALSTVLLLISSLLVLIFSSLNVKKADMLS
ncbi:MAG: ABC transporter permease [Candidatus Babeliales bacterium]